MKKKVIYLILLIVLIVGIVLFFSFLNGNNNEQLNNNLNDIKNESIDGENTENANQNKTSVINLNDGVLYSLTGGKVEADIVVGDNYFDTQITDMMLNYSSYENKKIEIEGMYLPNSPYTLVGRYSTSSMCPYCSGGYSYIEYVWDGEKIDLTETESWIKIVGTLEKGNDESSYYQDYYYIKALCVEVMNERGQDTINN